MAKKKETLSFEIKKPAEQSELLGHFSAEKLFLDAWNNRNSHPIHPVWILSGVKGIGKATLAHRIARFVLANAEDDLDAGGFFGPSEPKVYNTLNISEDSPEFQKYIDGGYTDLTIMSLETVPDEKQSISVEFVRTMIEKLQISSASDSWRVVIIDAIDDMKGGASNALLKILEEPPAKTLFLIIAHRLNAVLPTIRSRATLMKMGVLKDQDLRSVLLSIIPTEEQMADGFMDTMGKVIRVSGGSVAKALTIIGTGAENFPDFFALSDAIANPKTKSAELLNIAKILSQNENTMSALLDIIYHLSMEYGGNLDLAMVFHNAGKQISTARSYNIEGEATAYKIITEIRKCLQIPTAI